MVKLNNGTFVPLENFIKWHSSKQRNWTMPLEEKAAIIAKIALTKRKAVITPLGEFERFKDAVKAHGIVPAGLRSLIHNTAYPEYTYANPKHINPAKAFHKIYRIGPKKTTTPIGTFRSKIAAANALGLLKDQLGNLMLTNPQEYYFAEGGVNKSIRISNIPKNYKPSKIYKKTLRRFPLKFQSARVYALPLEQFNSLLIFHPDEFYNIKRREKLSKAAFGNM